MCITGESESGHGGRFEPCAKCKRLQAENAELRQRCDSLREQKQTLLESSVQLKAEIRRLEDVSMDSSNRAIALRQERDRFARIVETADALVEAVGRYPITSDNDPLFVAFKAYQEARNASS